MPIPENPINPTEQYLNRMVTGEGELPPHPITRTHQYLEAMTGTLADLKSDFDDVTENKIDPIGDIVYPVSANRLNTETLVANTYINQATGNAEAGNAYTASDWIFVGDADTVNIGAKSNFNVALRYAFYNANKAFISGGLFDYTAALLNRYYGNNSYFATFSIPANAKYFRFSALNAFFTTTPYVFTGRMLSAQKAYSTGEYKLSDQFADHRYLSALSESSGNCIQNCWNTTAISIGTAIELGVKSSVKGRETISFFSPITTMGEIRIGFKGTTYLLHVDATDYWFTNNGTAGGKYPHELTMKDYLYIVMTLGENGASMSGKIVTNGGIKTIQNSTFVGTRGLPHIESNGFSSGVDHEVRASWMVKTSKPIWVFGDSYISNYSNNRWGYYLIDWGLADNVLFNGYPGEDSATGLEDFKALLEIGTPAYAVWCLGMNDGDNGAINASWKSCAEEFIALCEKKGIIPILATIPNVPTVTHTYKNAWVKDSGYRYVDFAYAVNAESANATWYDGMLAEDNTHPDIQGAICLASAFIDYVPEVAFK